jgi:hypothetical protein
MKHTRLITRKLPAYAFEDEKGRRKKQPILLP